MDLRGKALLGVDIGTHSVKIVEIRRAYGGGVILVNYDIQEIQRSGDRAEADAQGPIVTAIRSILERQGIKTRRAVCVIGGQEATVRRILLPPIPEKEWPEAIAWEARNQAPSPWNNAHTAIIPWGSSWIGMESRRPPSFWPSPRRMWPTPW